jgi:hypothetical protein
LFDCEVGGVRAFGVDDERSIQICGTDGSNYPVTIQNTGNSGNGKLFISRVSNLHITKDLRYLDIHPNGGKVSVMDTGRIGFKSGYGIDTAHNTAGLLDTYLRRTSAGVMAVHNTDAILGTFEAAILTATAENITDVPVSVNLAAGHTANALEVKDSAAADIFTVSPAASVTLTGTTPTIQATGTATNVDLDLLTKAGGVINVDNAIEVTDRGYSKYSFRTTGTLAFRADACGVAILQSTYDGVALSQSRSVCWSSDDDWYGTTDLRLKRASAETLGVYAGDGTTLGGFEAATLSTNVTLDAAIGNEIANTLAYTTNKATSGDDTGLLISKTDTASPGTSLLLDCQTGGVSQFSVDDTGRTTGNRFSFDTTYYNISDSTNINYGFHILNSSAQARVGLGSVARFNKDVPLQFCVDNDINTPDEYIARNSSGGIDIGKDTSTVVATIAQDGYGIKVTASAITDVPVTATGAVGQTASLGVFNDGSTDVLRIAADGAITFPNVTGSVLAEGTSATMDIGTAPGAGTHEVNFQVKGASVLWANPFLTNIYGGSNEVIYLKDSIDIAGLSTQVTTLSAATGNEVANTISYTTNKLTSGDDTGLLISKTDTASPGTSLLLDCQTDGISQVSVRDDGFLTGKTFWFDTGNYHRIATSNNVNYGLEVRDSSGNIKVGLGNRARLNKTVKLEWTSDGALNTPDEWMGRNASGGIDIGKDTSTVVTTIAQDGYGIQVTASAITDVPATFNGAVGQTADLLVVNNGASDVFVVDPTEVTIGSSTHQGKLNLTGQGNSYGGELRITDSTILCAKLFDRNTGTKEGSLELHQSAVTKVRFTAKATGGSFNPPNMVTNGSTVFGRDPGIETPDYTVDMISEDVADVTLRVGGMVGQTADVFEANGTSTFNGGVTTGAAVNRYTETIAAASDTLDATNHIIFADAVSNNVLINLPQASTCAGREYVIKKVDSSSNTVTVDGYLTETIDGGLTAVLILQHESITIVSDGTEWWII